MPEAWRIVKAKHIATAFSGEGAAKTGGRWNSRGVAVVYASATRSLSALETLAHLNPPMPFDYRIFRIEFSEKLVTEIRSHLPSHWRMSPPTIATMRIGDAWVRDARSPVLAVPSVIIPDEMNYLLNPAHPHFRKINIGKPEKFLLDARLLA